MNGGNLVINAVDSDVNFEGNSAYNGGAIYNNNSSKTITMNARLEILNTRSKRRKCSMHGYIYCMYLIKKDFKKKFF